jgi:hypothetical protein
MRSHSKINYEYIKIVDHSETENAYRIIKLNNKEYRVDYPAPPFIKIADGYCVYHNGIKYSSFSKLLKYLNTL